MMLERDIEKVLQIYNFIDGIMIVDTDGKIIYYNTSHPNINTLRQRDAIGRSLLDVYPSLTEEDSKILKVLKTGRPILDYSQSFTTYKGQTIQAKSSAFPILNNNSVIGVVDLVMYLNPKVPNKTIAVDIDQDKILKKSPKKVTAGLDDIITNDKQMLKIKDNIKLIKDYDCNVLVYGKTGTGKELIVQSIHNCSGRKNAPFIVQNCAAIPSNLLESILFGTVKGSFTGAGDSKGLIELANGGTLFLDEINSMGLDEQAKILRAIEEKKIRRVGDSKSIDIDVRIISAVNQDPQDCIKKGILREDLYYRLSVVEFDIPPLYERKGDIQLLMEYFRKYYNSRLKKDIKCYTNEVKQIFLSYTWPGNVRELKNAIEGAFYLSNDSIIDVSHIPVNIKESVDFQDNCSRDECHNTQSLSLTQMVDSYERSLISNAYIKFDKNISKTANALDISRQSLWYKIKKYDL